MEKINAVITGVGGYVPDYILTNEEISRMVDTNDEWIMTRIGVKERHILNEEGLGTSYMARKAAKQLMQRTGSNPDDIDLVIVATTTPDYHFPSTASILCDKLGLKHAFAFDLQAACSGFLYLLETGANFIRSGRYKKIILVGGDKMSSMVDYTERATCPIFGDGAAAVMMEPTTEDVGVMDAILRTDGKGLPFLHMKAGGSVCPPSYFTVDNHMHFLYQEGRTVFRYAVTDMSNDVMKIMEMNNLKADDVNWVIPHEANLRIIEAVTKRAGIPLDKVVVNIDHYGNTSAATIPLALWDAESQLKKGDNVIFTAFGAGFAGQAAVGAWKKCYASGKPAPFIMIAFSGAPLTQTIYGFLLMNFIKSAVAGGADAGLALGVGLFGGLAIGLSGLFQGKCAAAAADALGATGKGTANYFIVVGIVETVALFTLVFSLLLLG